MYGKLSTRRLQLRHVRNYRRVGKGVWYLVQHTIWDKDVSTRGPFPSWGRKSPTQLSSVRDAKDNHSVEPQEYQTMTVQARGDRTGEAKHLNHAQKSPLAKGKAPRILIPLELVDPQSLHVAQARRRQEPNIVYANTDSHTCQLAKIKVYCPREFMRGVVTTGSGSGASWPETALEPHGRLQRRQNCSTQNPIRCSKILRSC